MWDGQDTIESYCKAAVADLVNDSTFQADGIFNMTLTILERSTQSESVFDLVLQKRATGYSVEVGPAGASAMIRYFFREEDVPVVEMFPA